MVRLIINGRKIRGIITDLDGVILSIRERIPKHFNVTAGELELPLVEEGRIRSLIGQPLEGMIQTLYPNLDSREVESFLEAYRRDYFERMKPFIREIPGAGYTIHCLRNHGIKIAYQSAKPSEMMRKILEHLRIYKESDVIVGGDMVEQNKPYPEIILRLLELLYMRKNQVIAIGDTWYDIEAGNRAGVMTAAVRTGNYNEETMKKYHPDLTLPEIGSLLNYMRYLK